MRLLAWNIQSGGAKRAAGITAAITAAVPDVVVLTELRPSSAGMLAQLRTAGWSHQLTALGASPSGTVGILAREPLEERPWGDAARIAPGRILEAWLPDAGVAVCGIYGLLHREPYRAFWDAVLAELPTRLGAAFVLAGDLNTGRGALDAADPQFFCSAYFARLEQAGLADTWRRQHGDRQEFSYEHRVRGGPRPGFRLDHVLVSPTLAARLRACDYQHEYRVAGLSDHSPLLAEFDVAVV